MIYTVIDKQPYPWKFDSYIGCLCGLRWGIDYFCIVLFGQFLAMREMVMGEWLE